MTSLLICLLFCLLYSRASPHERECRHNELGQLGKKYLSHFIKLPLSKYM